MSRSTLRRNRRGLMRVKAVVTLFLYLFAMVFPAIKRYHGYMLPLNLVLSYLWLTSLIFTSQDYSGGRCGRSYYYTRSNHCSLKHAVQAFEIIGLCVLSHGLYQHLLLSDTTKQLISLFQHRLGSPDMGEPPQNASRHRYRKGTGSDHHRPGPSGPCDGRRGANHRVRGCEGRAVNSPQEAVGRRGAIPQALPK